MRMLVVAIIGRPRKSHPTVGNADELPSMGAEKPLLEERCHEVTEWWQMRILVEANIGHPKKPPHSRQWRQLPQWEPKSLSLRRGVTK